MKIPTNFKLIITLISIIIGLLLPFLLYLITGELKSSFSEYHNSDAREYLFILLILMASGFFTGKDTYKVSGVLLLGVAFFTVDTLTVHNIFAGAFFLYTTFLIVLDKRFNKLSIPIIISATTIPFMGLYFFEFVAVWSIAFFNTLYILRYLRIINLR